MYKKYLLNTLYFIIGIILLGVIYEVIVLMKNNSYFTPQFDKIFKFLGETLKDTKTWISTLNTIKNVIISVAISFIIAIVFSTLAYRFNIIDKILHPMIQLLRFIPIIILINVIWFIFLMQAKTYVLYLAVFSMVFPLVYENIYEGLVSIDKIYIDAYKIYSNTTPYIVFKVYCPLVFSSIKSSIINSIGLGIKIALSCEFILAEKNTLGYLIQSEVQNGYDFSGVYSYIIVLIIVSIILELIPLAVIYIYGKIRDARLKKRFNLYGTE